MRNKLFDYKILFALIPILFLVLFFYYPIILVIKESLLGDSFSFDFSSFHQLLTNDYHTGVIWFTIKQSLISVLITLIIGIPAAIIFSHYDFPAKKLLKAISIVPFVLPGVIVSLGFILFYGKHGFINKFLLNFGIEIQILYSFKAIVLAHAFYNFPIIMKMLSSTLDRLNINMIYAADLLGAKPFDKFFRIILPSLLPSILNASMLVFIYCFMSFGIVLILGSVKFTTIEVNIYMLVHNLLKTDLGMALGTIQIIISACFLWISITLNKKHIVKLKLLSGKVRVPKRIFFSIKSFFNIKNILMLFYFFLLYISILGPIVSIIYYSLFMDKFHNFHWNGELFVRMFSNNYDPIIGSSVVAAIRNSLILGLLTAFLSVFLSYLMSKFIISRKRQTFWEVFTILPLGVSSVTFTLGYLKILQLPVIQEYRFLLLIFAHVIIAFPFVFRIVIQSIRNVHPHILQAAYLLGAKEITINSRIVLPLIKKDLFLAGIFAFAISLGELGATSMLRKNFTTLPYAIYRYIGSYRFPEATAMGVILIFVACIVFYISELQGKKDLF